MVHLLGLKPWKLFLIIVRIEGHSRILRFTRATWRLFVNMFLRARATATMPCIEFARIEAYTLVKGWFFPVISNVSFISAQSGDHSFYSFECTS